MAYNSRLQSSFIQTYPENTGNTVGTVVSTVRAFRLADCTADRDSHPALKLCGDKGIPFFKKFKIILKVYFKFLYLQSCNTDNCGNSSVGRASASQAEGRGFESRFPLHFLNYPPTCQSDESRCGIELCRPGVEQPGRPAIYAISFENARSERVWSVFSCSIRGRLPYHYGLWLRQCNHQIHSPFPC